MHIELSGFGCVLPKGSLTQTDAAHAANHLRRFDEDAVADRQLQLLTALYRRSGVQKRHSVLLLEGETNAIDRQTFYEKADSRDHKGPGTEARMQRYEQHAPELAEQACREALTEAETDPSEITHLVTVSCSGFNSPGYDLSLFDRLNLNRDTSRTHVGFMGCHGALNGLRVARALLCSQPNAVVLLCAVELCTLHHQYTDEPQQIVANSLFADGAAAVVMRAIPPHVHASSEANAKKWHLVSNGSYLLPDSQEAMSWRIGDNGFQMTLSAQVPELIKTHLKPWLEHWLGKQGIGIHQVASWAVHPGGPRILSATSEALSLPEKALEASTHILSQYGNMSSPTILFILNHMQQRSATGACVALAFGPGLVVESALLKQ